jgi:chromosome condensin MukBEF complex kleisin-like MukF subunit
MVSWIDGSLYPDTEVPETLDTVEARIDFISRLCSAWDFGILPYLETIKEIRKEDWRTAVDECRLLTSPTYHLLREWHDLEPLPYLGDRIAYICDDPNLEFI